MRVVFDLDGTICEEKPTFEKCLAKILPGAKEKINLLYDTGDTIIIYTGRSWAEYEMTKDWLNKNGIKFHQLLCGKPIYDIWIDDKAIKFKNWEETKII